jgi:hypothetical protein
MVDCPAPRTSVSSPTLKVPLSSRRAMAIRPGSARDLSSEAVASRVEESLTALNISIYLDMSMGFEE